MRTRTRNFTPLTNCTVDSLTETFIDIEVPSKTWKECVHTSKKVISFTAPSGFYTATYDDPSHSAYSDEILSAKNFPGFSWEYSFWKGWVPEFPSPEHEIELKAIDVDSLIMDLSRSSTNVAECIATMTGTANLFRRPASFLKHVSKKGLPVSRRPLKELRSSLDTAGKTWLAGTYGYLPLISDLVELTSVCTQPRKTLDKLKRPVKRDIRDSNSISYSTDPIPDSYDTEAKYWGKTGLRTTKTVSRLIRLEGIPNPTFQAMSVANQMATYLGLNDFGRLAWELVPFSFVFDWFSHLGKSISSASALNGHMAYMDVLVSSAQKTVINEVFTSLAPTITEVYDSWAGIRHNVTLTGGSCEVESVAFARSKYGQGDTSGSSFSNGLSSYRTATGLALLLGQFGRVTGW